MFHHGVHHVSINVDDVKANKAFYVDKLGLTALDRPDLGIGGAWLQVGPQEIHLIELPLVEGAGPHFALKVDDIEHTAQTLRDRGVEVGEIRELDGVCLQAFFNDPASNQIEINQSL